MLVVDALADDHLMAMLEWSPMVLVTASAMPKVASWGIRVDAVFVDEHAHNGAVVLDAMPHVGPAIMVDSTQGLIPSVLMFLRDRRQYALQVMIQSPEEHFHTWDQVHDFQITLIDASTKWSRIPAGRFEKWMPEAAVLYVFADAGFEVFGTNKCEGNEVKATRSGMIQISSPAPFWVGEHHR